MSKGYCMSPKDVKRLLYVPRVPKGFHKGSLNVPEGVQKDFKRISKAGNRNVPNYASYSIYIYNWLWVVHRVQYIIKREFVFYVLMCMNAF